MAIESMVVLGLATLFLAVLAIYASKHRSEDKGKDGKGHHTPA